MSARAALSALGCLAASACFFPGFEKVEDGGGGSGGGQGGGSDVCESETFRKPPSMHSDPADPLDLYFALRTVSLGEKDLAHRPGFDLDRVCSCCEGCTTGEEQCIYPTQLPADYCDAIEGERNGGVDNNVAKFLNRALAVSPTVIEATDALTAAAESGEWSLIVRVYEYNGEPDDSQVSVALYTTSLPMVPPSWGGADVWPVRGDSLVDGMSLDAPTIVNHDAYVVANNVVGVFGGAAGKLRLNLESGFTIDLGYAIFQAELAKVGATWQVSRGVIGGMWSIADVFKSLGALRRNMMPVMCTDDVAYSVVKGALCTLRDSILSPMPTPCDSISFGAEFTALQIATPTEVVPPGDPGPGCDPALDPATDSCK